jgi:diaminohydroxyphosphoribosylaminopyrimidine deaminase/5-amino-6-(5-phosphoribosylamino)uracil reductase
MRRALELAERYRGRTFPNPIVGCVIVDQAGKVIAEGAHEAAGKPHAEADALANLGGKATGATLYVNLEPCTHQGRTPPCAPAVIASGVARVVIGTEDPIADHGGGIEALEAAGIKVDRELVAECDAANRPWLTLVKHKRPHITLKAAMTLDGKIATVKGDSKWITGEEARADAHQLRNTHDAVLVGIGTVLADDPQLTARVPGGRDPSRIVIDSKLRTPLRAKLLPNATIATLTTASDAKERALAKALNWVWRFKPDANGQVPLDLVVKKLGKIGYTSLLVEGGGEIHASFLAKRLADAVVLYVAPKIVGGRAPSWVGGKGIDFLKSAYGLVLDGPPEQLGADLKLRLRLAPRGIRP